MNRRCGPLTGLVAFRLRGLSDAGRLGGQPAGTRHLGFCISADTGSFLSQLPASPGGLLTSAAGLGFGGLPAAMGGLRRFHRREHLLLGLGGTHVVILTTFDLDEYVFEGIRAGAAGFLVKDTDPSELIRAVRVVAGGEALLSPKITLRLISEYASRSRSVRRVPGLSDLTAREREVVTLIASGLSNEEIAERLYLSVSTAKTHATRAMAKLGARDRAQLVVIAYESGLVRPGWTD
jgi:DNA-binding NarL/FixJ family response regulator